MNHYGKAHLMFYALSCLTENITRHSIMLWTKILILKITSFGLMKSGIDFFLLKFQKPLQPLANLSGQFSISGTFFCTGKQQL